MKRRGKSRNPPTMTRASPRLQLLLHCHRPTTRASPCRRRAATAADIKPKPRVLLCISTFRNQARLQRNLMYLAAIADSQPQPTPFHAQFPPSAAMQPGARYLQHQQAQSMTPQSLMAARSSMLYTQQPMSALQQQASLHSQLGMIPGGNNGLHMLQGDGSMGGNGALAARGFPDFGRSAGESLHAATSRGMTGTGRQDVGNAGSAEGRGGNGNTDGTEPLYLKSSEEEAN